MILAVLTVGAIISIYVYDMLKCIFEESPIPLIELITFTAILIVVIGGLVIIKKLSLWK